MADDDKIFWINPLAPSEQEIAAGIYSAILAGFLQNYREVAGREAFEEVKVELVRRVKNNEIGGVPLSADHAITTSVLQVLDLAFHASEQS